MITYDPIPLEKIREAYNRIKEDVIRTPLVKMNYQNTSAEIYLKLENLQPVRSFKIRGANNAIKLLDKQSLEKGVWTVSAGNHAQGVAWTAQKLGIKCTIVLPENVPKTKLEKIHQMGAETVKVSHDKYLQIYWTRKHEGVDGTLVHAFSDLNVMAGAGTIGIEIFEDFPLVDTILIPWGGGGLTCGIASALRALKPDVKILACEVETGAPLTASFSSGKALSGVDYVPSFIDGISAPWVFPEMFELARELIDGTIVVSLDEVADAVRLLVERNCVVAEGAGAVSVAAALSGRAGLGNIVCIVSGGNIDPEKLVQILQGQTP